MRADQRTVPQPTLNEAQARALTVGVRRLWDSLDQLDLLLEPSEEGEFRLLVQDLSEAERADLRDTIAGLRRELWDLAAVLRVEPERRSVRATFGALASLAWEIAEDLHPRKLGRYGPVDADAARTLAPLLEPIAARFLSLASRVNRLPATLQGKG